MSVEIQIRKFNNQFKNGSDLTFNAAIFTHFLLGFTGQRMRRVTRIATKWTAEASLSNKFVTNNGSNIATRATGSWIDDGFQIGDTVDYRHPAFNEVKTITNLTDLVVTFDTNFVNTSNNEDVVMFGTSRLLGLVYQSNLIENDDPVGYISKVDGISTKQWIGEFTIAEFDAGNVITATASGLVESWKMNSDLVTMQIIQQPIFANAFTTILEVIEVFTITPFFDNISNLEAGIKPDYLIDAASLRSIVRFEQRLTSLNPIVKHILDDSENPETDGNVGYYDEHANGFTPVEFSKASIDYVNASNEDKIVIDEPTSITCKIDSVNNVFVQGSTFFQMNIVFLNENLDGSDNIDTNFAFDTVFQLANNSAIAGENGIFSNVKGNIVANQLVVTADLTFSPAQQTLIEDGKYLISIGTDDHTEAIDQSKLVNVLMDINTFIKNNDVPGLMAVDTNLFYEHPHDKGTQGKTDFQGWVEDGILMSTDFTLDLSKDAVINNMNVRLMARNSVTDEDFEIANIPLDFASAIISGGVQQIDIDSTRGFKLVDGSQFNFLKVQTLAKVGNLQHYDLDIGFKLQWMDWQALVDADPVFFDNTKINDGLNRLISNYSALNDYDIVVFIDAEVSNGVLNTNYRFITPALRIFEYENDDTGSPSTQWQGATNTFDQSANDLNGNIHGTENTEVKTIFTALNGLISGVPLYAIPRIEIFQQGGPPNILELSTFRNAVLDNPLIPKSGENKAIFTVFPDRVEVEFAVDFTKLDTSSQYKISCRLGPSCDEASGCAWQAKNSNLVTRLLSVDFFNDSIGMACGTGGGLTKTTDGGDTWTTKPSGVGLLLNDVHFVSALTIYVCGQNGTLRKSTDGGDTWVDKNPGVVQTFFDLSFIDANTGWVCGLNGKIFRTDDGGDSWTDQSIATTLLLSIFFIDSDIGWTVGLGGVIFKTIDGGTNWIVQASGTTEIIGQVFFLDSDIGWAVTHADEVLLTTDGGDTWVKIIIPGSPILRSIHFLDADNGIICGDLGTIFRSSDEGNTWVQESSGTVGVLEDIVILALQEGVAVGNFGEIIKYECTSGCNILDDGKLKEDGTQKLTEDGNNKIKE